MRLLSILSISLCSWTCYTFSLITSSPHSTVGSFDPNNCVFEGAEKFANEQRCTSIHLLSLPKCLSPDLPSSNLIGWKQAALGDGGVYWDQRPKSLAALNSAVAEHVFHRLSSHNELSSSMTNVECAIISTCARFEILLCIQTTLIPSSSDDRTHATIQQHRQGAIISVAECLAVQMTDLNRFRQIKSWRRRDDIRRISTDTYSRWINITNAHLNRGDEAQDTDSDRISWIRQLRNLITWKYIQKAMTLKYQQRLLSRMKNVESILLHTEGVEPIARHLSRIAAGMENSIGIFRPFSSRDSHVMHQLKQSAAGAICVTHVNDSSKPRPIHKSVKYIKLIMDSALHAGKAARSPKQVPILDELREAMRKKDNDEERFEIIREAEQQALMLAVEPSVRNCVCRFEAMQNSKLLSEKYRKGMYEIK